MNREDHTFTLPKRYNLGTRLHARPLLSEYEFSSPELNVRSWSALGHEGARFGRSDRTEHQRPRVGCKHGAPYSQIYKRFATRIRPRGSSVCGDGTRADGRHHGRPFAPQEP